MFEIDLGGLERKIRKEEREAVIAEAREWADTNSGSVLKSENNYVPYDELRDKLDSMEQEGDNG